jgi:hypothetical protein
VILFNWFTVIMMAIGLLTAWRTKKVQWFIFFAVGIVGIWAFVCHAFIPERAAASIGWAPSPFQFEVAVANLGMGVAGLLAPWFRLSYSVAVGIMISCFNWGAAYGHAKQMVINHDYAINNAGPIFWTDILIPVVLWILLTLWRKKEA